MVEVMFFRIVFYFRRPDGSIFIGKTRLRHQLGFAQALPAIAASFLPVVLILL